MDFMFDFQVIDHYENPRNVGKLDAKKLNVGTGLVGAPACGDVMKLQVIPKSCTVLMITLIILYVPKSTSNFVKLA